MSRYGGKLVPNRTAEHFNSTHLLLTPFNLLTYINSFEPVNRPASGSHINHNSRDEEPAAKCVYKPGRPQAFYLRVAINEAILTV